MSINSIIEPNSTIGTIAFQVSIHADTKITENTPVTIEAQAGIGYLYAQNVSQMYVGFFGAQYTPKDGLYATKTNNASDRYELWNGFAGVTLDSTVKPNDIIIYPTNGTLFGGESKQIFWSGAGNEPLSIVLVWKNQTVSDSYFIYTYQYSIIPVYSMSEIRSNQIFKAEVISVVGGLIIGLMEAYARVTKDKKGNQKNTLQLHSSVSNKYPRDKK